MVPTNDGKHIENVMYRVTCARHNALLGSACYILKADASSQILRGVCNARARKAGANGKITESSFQTKRSQVKPKYANSPKFKPKAS